MTESTPPRVRPVAVEGAARVARDPRRAGPLLILLVALVLVGMAASASGAVSIPWRDLPRLLFGTIEPAEQLWRNVLIDVRIPRVLFGMVAGAALAVSGATMQALFRNPLAEPALIGISTGGAVGAVAAIVLGAGAFVVLAPSAFMGSLLATWLAYRIGTRVPGTAGLLLAGVAINAVCASLIGLFTFMADDTQLRSLTFWNMGSLSGASWQLLGWLVPWVALMSWAMLHHWRAMNALLLGEREAQHLGFDLKTVRRRLIVLCALLVGPVTAATGTIVFVGLVVPHLVRLTLGANHRILLPATVLTGALALALADWLARVVVIPAELPIGIVTSLIGGPFFLWLLARQRDPRQ